MKTKFSVPGFGLLMPTCGQSCLTLCDPMDCSSPGFSFHGIFQARIREWVDISSSRESSQPGERTHVSCVSCIGRWIVYHCTTWEAPPVPSNSFLHFLLSISCSSHLWERPCITFHSIPGVGVSGRFPAIPGLCR